MGTRRCARHHDALGIDHFAHDSSRGIGCCHQVRANPKLIGGHLLQGTEQDICCGVRTGQGHAQPSQKRTKERVKRPGSGQSKSEGGIRSRIFSEIPQRQHARDRQQRKSHFVPGSQPGSNNQPRPKSHGPTSNHTGK